MKNHLFIAPGTLTQISAHAIAYSASTYLGQDGSLYSAFQADVPGFETWYSSLRKDHGTEHTVGETFWMPLDPQRKPHGVVVSLSTGSGDLTTDDKARSAVRAALLTAVQQLRNLGKTERLLIALPAFRVGRGGDRRRRLHSARLQVNAALDTLGELEEVDAVFVTYTTPVYHIFLEARRERLGPTPTTPPGTLEDALLRRECVLFVGAGLSRGTGLPDWSELIARLAAALRIDATGLDYLDIAQWFREKFGTAALAEQIRLTYGDPQRQPLPSLAHYLLMSLPVRHVITTNYDELLEQSLTALKRYPIKVVHQSEVALTGQGQSVYVVKLHGDVQCPEEIVLCRDDYDEFFERRPAMALLLQGLLLNQTFLFVGYSLRDPNFRQIYSRIARMLRESARPAFASSFVEAGSDQAGYTSEQWRQKQLNLIPMQGHNYQEQEHAFLCFLDDLAERVALHAPRLFLAPDVAATPTLTRLRKLLMEEVGEEFERVCQRLLGETTAAADVRKLADVLAFLTEQGWRPEPRLGWDLCRLWEHLAAQTPERAERRRLLITALGCTEAFTDVQRVRGKLEDLAKKP